MEVPLPVLASPSPEFSGALSLRIWWLYSAQPSAWEATQPMGEGQDGGRAQDMVDLSGWGPVQTQGSKK